MDDKRLPDDVGYWYSDEGQEIFVGRCKDGLWFLATVDMDVSVYGSRDTLEATMKSAGIRHARWKLAEPPEFESLPGRPPLAYLFFRADQSRGWAEISSRPDNGITARRLGSELWIGSDAWELLPHDDNDPVAIELIEMALETRDDE